MGNLFDSLSYLQVHKHPPKQLYYLFNAVLSNFLSHNGLLIFYVRALISAEMLTDISVRSLQFPISAASAPSPHMYERIRTSAIS